MRPPGYVRPELPFDSLEQLLVAAGVDPTPWHGVHVLADHLVEVARPEAETRPINRLREPIVDLLERAN